MGYYTKYTITDNKGIDQSHDLLAWIIKNQPTLGFSESHRFYFNGQESMKWYDHADEMRAFSKAHPDTMYILHGKGESDDDIWKMYCKNGKIKRVKAELVFPKVKESDLE